MGMIDSRIVPANLRRRSRHPSCTLRLREVLVPAWVEVENVHRPWPAPRSPWVLQQSWRDLLFAHWPVDAGRIRSHLPAGLALDLFHGQAWLSVAAFELADLRWRLLPPIPTATTFAELNLRTYVRMDAVPGVFFFSLDAASTLAVAAARLIGLTYRRASMSIERVADGVVYRSRRSAEPDIRFEAWYAPSGPVFEAPPGSLDEWLVERYCLYTRRAGWWRLEIDHHPWRLQPAEVSLSTNTLADPLGLCLGEPALVHFSRRQDMVAWAPVSV
jgi:uncharacterized protein YqjF (DUF2071 family)